MNIEDAKKKLAFLGWQLNKPPNYTTDDNSNYENAKAIEIVLSELENLESKLERIYSHFKKNYDIIDEISKWLVGYTYSDENNREAIFNNEEEVIDYFTYKVVMKNRKKAGMV